jgi:hypothetical protein
MTHDEQHRMIVALMDYEHRMSRNDGETFAMFVKRDKDDEDLDTLSQQRLAVLHEKYVVHRRR